MRTWRKNARFSLYLIFAKTFKVISFYLSADRKHRETSVAKRVFGERRVGEKSVAKGYDNDSSRHDSSRPRLVPSRLVPLK